MTYFEKLSPWCIIRPLPTLQRRIIARFRRRNDAEAHLQVIRRLIPHVTYEIVFDPTPEHKDELGTGAGEKVGVAQGDIRAREAMD